MVRQELYENYFYLAHFTHPTTYIITHISSSIENFSNYVILKVTKSYHSLICGDFRNNRCVTRAIPNLSSAQ